MSGESISKEEAFKREIISKLARNNTITVIVHPKSPKNEVISYDSSRDAFKINIKAEPEKGKANAELIKFLRKFLKKDVEIISGHKGHRKVVRVS